MPYDNRDRNETSIIAALKIIGATVERLAPSGRGGVPDLLVGYHGRDYKMEVKTKNGKLSPTQKKWHREWRGAKTYVVRTPEQAIKIVQMDDE